MTALALSGCLPTTRSPERLFPAQFELDSVQKLQGDLFQRYSDVLASSPSQAKIYRNEIIAQRMYAVDVQYTIYESALTREGQEVGFGALTAAEGLSTAATLAAPAAARILSASATGVLAMKGHYESEILIAQTIRTIQKQMRSSRALVAAKISALMEKSAVEYPLWIALSDVEEYYSAGTITSGVIDTSTTVGLQETDNKAVKQAVTIAPTGQRANVLSAVTNSDTVAPKLRITTVATDRTYVDLRAQLFPGGSGAPDASLVSYVRKLLGNDKIAIGPILDQPQFSSLRRRISACIVSRQSGNDCASGSLARYVQ